MPIVTPGTRRAMSRPPRDVVAGSSERGLGVALQHPFVVGLLGTLGVLSAVLIGMALSSLSTVLLYVGAALFIALGLDPAVRRLQKLHVGRWRIGRGWAIVIVLLILGIVLGGILALVVPLAVNEFGQLVNAVPRYLTNISDQDWFHWVNQRVGGAIDLDAMTKKIQEFASNPDHLMAFTGGLFSVGVGVANVLTGTMIILILSLYFLGTMPAIKSAVYALVARRSRPQFIRISEQIADSIGGYVQGMVTLAALNAALGFCAMLIFGVPYAGILAVIVFLLALIPLIGSVLATILVTLIALFNSPVTALEIGLYYLVYMQVEAYVLTPRIMNRTVSVPGSLVVIGALAGGTLLGLFGALIAIPVTASIILVVKQVFVPRQNRLV